MSDPRDEIDDEIIPDDDGIALEDDREDFAPLDQAELRGDEQFDDLPPLPDEPTGPGVDFAEIPSEEIEETT
jgi:hypothetical protein